MPYIAIPTEVAEEVLVVMQEDLATEEGDSTLVGRGLLAAWLQKMLLPKVKAIRKRRDVAQLLTAEVTARYEAEAAYKKEHEARELAESLSEASSELDIKGIN